MHRNGFQVTLIYSSYIETMVYTGQDKYNRNIFVMINNL